ncbi:riboflavin synthase [Limnochorda pilosa]|uniref:Riboflavin synthase n=1 Tax=Limnochorda pilosa TaxID=1555112 RepID=A0A0K2SPQ1_LIMPI|nr:riboflavin synthase [Limnochorda pilosa]BAS29113.1 riboflavin synthase subunit alpha [Limnochorda pilosa]
MFTGIVEEMGRVTGLERREGLTRLEVAARRTREDLEEGSSISVNGTCLTVVALGAGSFTVECAPETLARTNLGALKPGDPVNLERALRMGDRLDGHMVLGHVDGTARVVEVHPEGETHRIWLLPDPELARYLPYKGSVALDGVSMTVAERRRVGDQVQVAVMVIPHTHQVTTLGRLRPGDRVNVEIDPLARYLESLLESGLPYGRPEEAPAP